MKNSFKNNMPKFILNFYRHIKYNIFDGYALRSYSQEGEDLILNRIFENKKTGFYVDVGAHHPKRFSNTYFFYKKGWHGINIDAMPGSMELFNKFRPRDINLECAISEFEDKRTYYMFEEPALNTFSPDLARSYLSNGQRLDRKITVTLKPLSIILKNYINNNKIIDFMTIDAEGYDLEVIKSNNWQKYKPKIIAIEILDFDFIQYENSEIYNFLAKQKYKLVSKTLNTLFFKLEN